MATILMDENIIQHTPGREHGTFPNFPRDLVSDINLVDLNKWLNKQKTRAYIEMQIH